MNQIPNIEEELEKYFYSHFSIPDYDNLPTEIRLTKAEFLEKYKQLHHHQLQKALAEGYEQGYTQGKFNEKMDAEYKHPEELQKARQDWLQEEIVKLKGMIHEINTEDEYAKYDGQNKAIQTIIDRYQAEVDQDKALQDKK